MKILVFLLALLHQQGLLAQVVRQPLTVRYASLGAYSNNFSDIFSGTSNQASVAGLQTAAFAVFGEQQFMLNELKAFTAVAAVPTSSGTIGFQADHFGSSNFRESQLGILYARKVTEQVHVGIKFNYHSVGVAGYGNATALNFEGGAIFHLTDKLHSGIHVYNPTRVRLGKTGDERLASVYRFGLGYEASDKVFIGTEIVKQYNSDVSIQVGLQYNVHEKVFIRAGISTLYNNSYASLGLQLKFASVYINTAYHPQLGFTPGLLIIFQKKALVE